MVGVIEQAVSRIELILFAREIRESRRKKLYFDGFRAVGWF